MKNKFGRIFYNRICIAELCCDYYFGMPNSLQSPKNYNKNAFPLMTSERSQRRNTVLNLLVANYLNSQ